MAITAADVKKLREATGVAMMDCKKALTEAEGDFEKAIALLREKGLAVAAKRADRTAAEGIIYFLQSDDKKTGVLVELNCETSFVAANDEFVAMAKDIADAAKAGDALGLTEDELAFYDALTKPAAVKDFYENAELIAITKELTETLRKNRTIDWQKKETARARMRMMIKKLLKAHKYPPEGQDEAIQTVMQQCELWADRIAE